MVSIATHTVTHEGRDYRFELSLDDAKIVEDRLHIGLAAKSRPAGAGRDDWQGIEASVEIVFHEDETAEAVVSVEENEVARFPLDGLDIGFPFDDEQVFEVLGDRLTGTMIEEAIQALPAFDPILGCLVKAGISSAVGQAIRCYNEARGAGRLRERVRQTLYCLGENSVAMIWTMSQRTVRCVILGGMG